MNSKSLVKWISAVSAVLIILAYNNILAGRSCQEKIALLEYELGSARLELAAIQETAELQGESLIYNNGTYTGTAFGYNGDISVEVSIEDDEITAISIVSAAMEDPLYVTLASSVIDDMISTQSADVDAVTGATYSSKGIINAVDNALGKAEK